MYYIKESEWKELEKKHPDYCGKSIHNPKKRVIFESIIPGNNGKGGTTLLTEGLHFVVVPDGKFTERGGRAECKAENVVDYFHYHNKNITKAQEWKIEELAEALQLIK